MGFEHGEPEAKTYAAAERLDRSAYCYEGRSVPGKSVDSRLTIECARTDIYVSFSGSRWVPLLSQLGALYPSVGHTKPSKLIVTVSGKFGHVTALGRLF